MKVTRADLEALRDKYGALAELRRTREAAIAQGLTEFPPDDRMPRRVAMKRLAATHPGALRELDETDAETLAGRAAAIEAVLAGAPIAAWITAAILFHVALREALAIRASARNEWRFWTGPASGEIGRPPTGRLLDVVWTAVARELGVTAGEAERLVYPLAPARGVRR